jgi:hypothetical protein
MNHLKLLALKAPSIGTFNKARVTQRNKRGTSTVRIVIKRELNGPWDDAFRVRLCTLCKEFWDLGFKWETDTPQTDYLITNDENGQPWMLFNGGEVIILRYLVSQVRESGGL